MASRSVQGRWHPKLTAPSLPGSPWCVLQARSVVPADDMGIGHAAGCPVHAWMNPKAQLSSDEMGSYSSWWSRSSSHRINQSNPRQGTSSSLLKTSNSVWILEGNHAPLAVSRRPHTDTVLNSLLSCYSACMNDPWILVGAAAVIFVFVFGVGFVIVFRPVWGPKGVLLLLLVGGPGRTPIMRTVVTGVVLARGPAHPRRWMSCCPKASSSCLPIWFNWMKKGWTRRVVSKKWAWRICRALDEPLRLLLAEVMVMKACW